MVCDFMRPGPALRHLLAALCLALLPAISWAAPFAYIANFNSSNVSVIDTASNTVVATVAVGTNPQGVSVNPAGTRVYVTNLADSTVSVINTASNTVTATVAVGASPYGVSVNPAGTRAYVTNASNNSVSVIDTASNTVTATVAVGAGPFGVAVNPAGARVYVTNYSSNSVSVIDTSSNTVAATVPVGSNPGDVAVNPAGTRVYVTNLNSNSVSVIDTVSNTVVATVAVGSFPQGVSVNPAGTRVYVTSDSVSVIDTSSNAVTATVAVANRPYGVSVNPAGTRVYVTNGPQNNVSVIDTASNTVTATVAVGSSPFSFGNFIGPDAAAPTPAPATPIPPLPTLPPVAGIGGQPAALDLSSGQGPGMTSCLLATVRSLLGANANYVGQTANGVAQFNLGGGRLLALYPVQANTIASTTNGISLTSSNLLNVDTTCGGFTVTPALYSLGDFGSVVNGMGLTASISTQGVMTVVAGNTVFVARPDYIASTGSPVGPRLVQGSDGLYRLTDKAGNMQILRPAFLDSDNLPAQAQQAIGSGGWTTIQTDGTALFTAFSGQQYVLVPDLTLSAASGANADKLFWQDGPNHYLYRSSTLTLAQGFTVQKR